MSKTRGGLGRGLGALIPTAPATPPVPAPVAPAPAQPMPAGVGPAVAADQGSVLAPVPGARFAEIGVESIVPNPKQPRQVFDEEALEELKASISEVGFLQPIVVREVGGDKYELVMGE